MTHLISLGWGNLHNQYIDLDVKQTVCVRVSDGSVNPLPLTWPLGQNPEDGGCVLCGISPTREAEPHDLQWVRDRWWGQQRGPSLLDTTAKHSILLLWRDTEKETPGQIRDVAMLRLSSLGLLIWSSYSSFHVFFLLSLIWIITLFSLSADACLHACTFCMLIKENSVFLSALLNHFVHLCLHQFF